MNPVEKTQFNPVVLLNVAIMLRLNNIPIVIFTGTILLPLHHPIIQTSPTIQTMLLMSSKRVRISVVVRILLELFNVLEQKI